MMVFLVAVGNQDEICSSWGLLGPAFVLLIMLLIVFMLCWKFTPIIDNFLAEKKWRRGGFYLFAIVILALFCGAWADIIDVTDLISGNLHNKDIPYLYSFAALLPFFFATNYIWWIHGDRWEDRLKAAVLQKEQQQRIALYARQNTEFVHRVAEAFIRVVGFRAERLHKAINNSDNEQATIDLKTAFAPDDQMFMMIDATRRIYEKSIDSRSSLRTVLFREENRILKPIIAWDGITKSCLHTPATDLDMRMRLNDPTNSLAVWTACHGGIEIIESTANIPAQGTTSPFRFFNNGQINRIGSIMSIFLPNPDKEGPKHVLTLDTNKSGFFKNSERWKAEIVQKHLTHRLFLEFDLKSIFDYNEDT
jgi:hypothetical protein